MQFKTFQTFKSFKTLKPSPMPSSWKGEEKNTPPLRGENESEELF
jgi:hypothetical protein